MDDLHAQIEKAKFYFYAEGWSLSVSLKKAGITNYWWRTESIVKHPDVVRMREINRRDFYKKRIHDADVQEERKK